MARLPNFLRSSALAALVVPCLASALEVPAGTEIQVRLDAKLSTQNARVKDPVEAVVIAPVMQGDQFVIPAGATVRGMVEKASQSAKADQRSSLLLKFTEIEIDGKKTKLEAQVSAVENAREKVDEQGQINGILASETITGQLDAGISKVAEKYSGFAGILSTVKGAVLKAAEGDVTYEAGTDLALKLTAPLTVAGSSKGGPAAKLVPIGDESALISLVTREPFQTVAENPPKPSDVTNIMLIGTEEQVRQAFADAGWTNAAALGAQAKFETFRALAENRGYKEAPVSILLLEGKPPDIVFQKLNNTFAQRHHLRVWRRRTAFHDKPVWVIAATHDIGITFSEANRTFIHQIDPQIDRERAKVVNDLLITGHVQSLALVDRPEVPKQSQNATGDALETDAKMAVLVLN